jgi:hypothetical protein
MPAARETTMRRILIGLAVLGYATGAYAADCCKDGMDCCKQPKACCDHGKSDPKPTPTPAPKPMR